MQRMLGKRISRGKAKAGGSSEMSPGGMAQVIAMVRHEYHQQTNQTRWQNCCRTVVVVNKVKASEIE